MTAPGENSRQARGREVKEPKEPSHGGTKERTRKTSKRRSKRRETRKQHGREVPWKRRERGDNTSSTESKKKQRRGGEVTVRRPSERETTWQNGRSDRRKSTDELPSKRWFNILFPSFCPSLHESMYSFTQATVKGKIDMSPHCALISWVEKGKAKL